MCPLVRVLALHSNCQGARFVEVADSYESALVQSDEECITLIVFCQATWGGLGIMGFVLCFTELSELLGSRETVSELECKRKLD
jgi:hypothetical protein